MNAGGWSVDLTRETGWLLARTSELGQNIFKTNKQTKNYITGLIQSYWITICILISPEDANAHSSFRNIAVYHAFSGTVETLEVFDLEKNKFELDTEEWVKPLKKFKYIRALMIWRIP